MQNQLYIWLHYIVKGWLTDWLAKVFGFLHFGAGLHIIIVYGFSFIRICWKKIHTRVIFSTINFFNMRTNLFCAANIIFSLTVAFSSFCFWDLLLSLGCLDFNQCSKVTFSIFLILDSSHLSCLSISHPTNQTQPSDLPLSYIILYLVFS